MCLGIALPTPGTAGKKGQARGLRDQLAVRPQDEACRTEEVSARFACLSCRLLDTRPGQVGRTFGGDGVAGQLPRGR